MLLENRTDLKKNDGVGRQKLWIINEFRYFGGFISQGGCMSNEVFSRISDARSGFYNFRHLWGILLLIGDQVYRAALRLALLHGSEIRSLRAKRHTDNVDV